MPRELNPFWTGFFATVDALELTNDDAWAEAETLAKSAQKSMRHNHAEPERKGGMLQFGRAVRAAERKDEGKFRDAMAKGRQLV